MFNAEQNSNCVFQVSEKSPDLKKNRKVPHAQDLLKEARLPTNTSNTWSRPRCGVPDFPTQNEVQYQERNRQRRYVLYGGRLDKTDLTYRYSMELRLKNEIFGKVRCLIVTTAKTLRSFLIGIIRYLQFVFTFMPSVVKTALLPVIPVFLRYRVLPKRIDTL